MLWMTLFFVFLWAAIIGVAFAWAVSLADTALLGRDADGER